MRYYTLGDIIQSKYVMPDEHDPLVYLILDVVTEGRNKCYLMLNIFNGDRRTLTFYTVNKNYKQIA
jgi:hypothetical protein